MQLASTFLRALARAPRPAVAGLALALAASVATDAEAAVQTLRWQHADATTVAGFRVYTRSVSGSFGVPAFDGLPAPDASGVYHFDLTLPDGASVVVAVTAYDAQGLESPLSNERQYDMPAPPASPAPGTGGTALTTYRVNAGGSAYTDSQGQQWEADGAYVTGGTAKYSHRRHPLGTSDPYLYQSDRFHTDPATTMTYEFPVPDGRYRVRVHAMEAWDELAPGQRVFDVSLEGQVVLDDFDMLVENAQWGTALMREFTVDVTDGALTVAFDDVVFYPTVSALEVVQLSSTPGGTTTGGGTDGGSTGTGSGGTSTGGDTGGTTGDTGSGTGSTDPGTSPPLIGAPGQPQVIAP